jgi:hypothetical protein
LDELKASEGEGNGRTLVRWAALNRRGQGDHTLVEPDRRMGVSHADIRERAFQAEGASDVSEEGCMERTPASLEQREQEARAGKKAQRLG